MISPHLSFYQEHKSLLEKDGSWLLLLVKTVAKERLWVNLKPKLKLPPFKKNLRLLVLTLVNLVCIVPSLLSMCCSLDSSLKKPLTEVSISLVEKVEKDPMVPLRNIAKNGSNTSSLELPLLSSLFLKVSHLLSWSLLLTQSKRCLSIRISSRDLLLVKLWVVLTTFAQTRLEPWPWTKWLLQIFGLAEIWMLKLMTLPIHSKITLTIKNTLTCSNKLFAVTLLDLSKKPLPLNKLCLRWWTNLVLILKR